MKPEKAIAVTGLGLVTALGQGIERNWSELVKGCSGVRRITRFFSDELPTQIAASVLHYDLVSRSDQDRTVNMACDSLKEALAQSRFDEDLRADSRLFMATPQPDVDWSARLLCRRFLASAVPGKCREDWENVPREIRDVLANCVNVARPGDVLSQSFGFGHPPICITTACASGASAIQVAVERIRTGQCKTATVVGSDSTVSPEGVLRFALLSALSTRNDAPERACRPFCRDRDGFVIGEGSAALVLESVEHALSRKADILGYVLGCGDTTDNYHRTRGHPSGESIVGAMAGALADAGLQVDEVDYINAHGTGTPENDRMEALGISRLFGKRSVPVSSNKSMIGHTLAAAGAVEAVISLLSIRRRILPPTINYVLPDPEISLDVVPNHARAYDAQVVLSNSFGFGGQNVCLVLGSSDLFRR